MLLVAGQALPVHEPAHLVALGVDHREGHLGLAQVEAHPRLVAIVVAVGREVDRLGGKTNHERELALELLVAKKAAIVATTSTAKTARTRGRVMDVLRLVEGIHRTKGMVRILQRRKGLSVLPARREEGPIRPSVERGGVGGSPRAHAVKSRGRSPRTARWHRPQRRRIDVLWCLPPSETAVPPSFRAPTESRWTMYLGSLGRLRGPDLDHVAVELQLGVRDHPCLVVRDARNLEDVGQFTRRPNPPTTDAFGR